MCAKENNAKNFKPLEELMLKKNSAYYKSPKTKIHDDFLTYAQSKEGLLSHANAREFINYAAQNPKEKYDILEVGVGNGSFAYSFLDFIKKAHPSLLPKISYTLADFSKPILESAFLQASKFGDFCQIEKLEFDACTSQVLPKKFDFIRCNELFSDLPAKLYVNCDGEVSEVLFDNEMKACLAPAPGLDELELKLLSALPKNYFIPINRTAANSILSMSSSLSNGGIMRIFDYGFYNSQDFEIPSDMWNLSIVREYGSQWTVDLNFLYLAAFLSSQGLQTDVQKQKDYAQNAIGKKLSHASVLSGLDYSKSEDEFEEDDSFYSIKITKPE